MLCQFLELFKNLAAGMTLLLLVVFVKAEGHAHKEIEKREVGNPFRNEAKPRLFLIAVIDSDDKIIGKRCEKDLGKITESFEEFTNWLDLAILVPKIIKGAKFSKVAVNDAIENWLPSQEPDGDDIVVFYFSGHGFRFSNDESAFPRMWLKTAGDQNPETANLSLEEDIYDRIVTMGAGINLVLSDCCNSVPGANTSFATSTIVSRETERPNKEELENDRKDFDDLFMPDNPLSIIATAADSTELAGGTPEIGGFFTHFLLEALDISIYEDELEPTWESILNYAKEEARKKALGGECPDNKHNNNGRCIQTAIYNMEPGSFKK